MPRFLAAALAAALIAPAAAQAHDGARVFVTTPDRALQLSDQGTAPFTRGAPTISVDPSQSFQTMEGWGASITDSSAAVLYRLDRRTRDRAMTALFKTDGLSYLRQPMGASDFVDEPHYTYDDVAPGETDYNAEFFTLGHAARFVKPGAARIASSEGVGFRNRDGTIALIVHNTTDAARPVRIGAGSRSAAYTLPPGALATFVWR